MTKSFKNFSFAHTTRLTKIKQYNTPHYHFVTKKSFAKGISECQENTIHYDGHQNI